MLGRIAAVKPWIFREFAGLPAWTVDHPEVWDRLYRYTLEDMPPERAFGRLMEFTFYFAKNFFFGHELYKCIQKARNPRRSGKAADSVPGGGAGWSPERGIAVLLGRVGR